MRLRWGYLARIGAGAACACAVTGAALAGQQVRTIDPNQAIDRDLRGAAVGTAANARPAPAAATAPRPRAPTAQSVPDGPHYPDAVRSEDSATPPPAPIAPSSQDVARTGAESEAAASQTFQQRELLSAAEGTFGKGAAGLAGILERTLKEQGRPNAYIAGREAAGAVLLGLRYGKGTMFHKIEGQQPVYWTGPSLGFDLGGDANKVFVLVYNLYDAEDLYRRFPAAEGRLYAVGGFAATYLRRGNIVIIPIRLGIGWRQGVNVGYMKFSHKSRWVPF